MKNSNDDYYAGFDIGTDSVGYAVADTDYNLCKFKGNAMWVLISLRRVIQLPREELLDRHEEEA